MNKLSESVANLSEHQLSLLEKRLKRTVSSDSNYDVIRKRNRPGPIPLSFGQEQIWFLDQLDPENNAYVIDEVLLIEGELNVVALEWSLNEIVRRHEALRTTYAEVDGAAVQIVRDLELKLHVIDLQSVEDPLKEDRATRVAHEQSHRGFNLERGPLMRAALVRISFKRQVLAITIHHIAVDGWSLRLMLQELGTLYESFGAGKPPLRELEIQYADYAIWQRNWVRDEVVERQAPYWKKQLSHAPQVLDLPTDRTRPDGRTYSGNRIPITIDTDLTRSLRDVGQSLGKTLFMMLLSGFNLLLHRYSGQTDILVGIPTANRNRVDIEELIGYFVNTLVIRSDLSGNPTVSTLLDRIYDATLGAYEHQDLPFEKLVEELQPERAVNRTPLFQVMFALQNSAETALKINGIETRRVELARERVKFDLTISFVDSGEELSGWIEYSRDLFDEVTIQRMRRHLLAVLQQIVLQTDRMISELQLLSPAETHQLTSEWNDTERGYRRESSIQELIEEQRECRGEAVALVEGDRSITYSRLSLRANQLGWFLWRLGVCSDELVGLRMKPGIELVIGMLGILKAGAGYVPLDEELPPDRLTLMIEDAAIRTLITDTGFQVKPQRPLQIITVPADSPQIERESDVKLVGSVAANQVAYVMFTSGSTGTPKGVVVLHRGVVRLVDGPNYANLTHNDVVLQASSPSFDASTFEIWGALVNGGRLVFINDRVPTADALRTVIQQQGVTTIWLTATLFNAVIEEDPTALSGLKQLLVGGEALSVSHIRNAKKELSGTKLINGYGPTEATTFSCTFEIGNVLEGACSIPIGSPISNSTVFVLDDSFQSVPIGVHGELYIGGDGLASGYLGRPEQTAERFIPDSLSGAEGGRLYRTGDLVRFLAEGNIDFLGRTDKQVKIRGYRIELGEIEAVLQSHPAVKQIAVVVNRGALDKKIVCCVVPQDPNEFNSSLLRSYLTHRLPHYMIPSQWVVLDHMPLTPGGKIDRVSLERVELLSGEHSEPKQRQKSPTQEVVSAIWCELLGVEQVGVGDNFFDLGGHSLLAMRVVSRLQKLLNVQLTVRAFFENPTIEHLSMLVDKAVSEGNYALARPIRPVDRMQKIPLSFAQQRLWFLDQLDPGNPSYNIPVALKLTGTLNVDALERSLNYLVRRQLSLRTSFVSQDGVPFQTIGDNVEYRLEVEDLRANADANLVASAKALQLARSPFDLSKGPLFRTRLFRTGHTEWLFVIVLHHIIGDGWSLEVLMRDLSQLYQRFAENSPGELPDLKLQYLDYAVWEREYLSAEAIEPSLKFWKEQLVGIPPVLELPQDKPRPSVQSYKGATVHLDFSPVLSNKLKLIARSRQSTLFMTLLTLFEVLLFRYCRQPLFSIGTPVANRSNPDVENIIGFFVNTLVIRAGLSTHVSFLDQLSLVRDTCLSAYAHQQLPFERLVEELHPDRNLSNTPLFQVMFSVRNTARLPDKLGTLDISQFNLDIQSAKFDLSLGIHDGADGLSLSLSYNTDVFDQVSIVRMLNHYQALSESAVFDPSQLVAQLQLLSPAETHQLTSEWNDTERGYRRESSIQELIEEQRECRGEAVALVEGDRSITYSRLSLRANQLGWFLRRLRVRSGELVGLRMKPGIELVIGMLGILKAGAGYVPLDEELPPDRLTLMIEDAAIRTLITDTGFQVKPQRPLQIITVPADSPQIERESDVKLVGSVAANQVAYVMFTSGSTGTPKGVVVLHRGVVRLVDGPNYANLTHNDVVLQASSPSFDASTFEIWGALVNGGRLVFINDRVPTADALRTVIQQQGVTTIWLTATLFNAVIEEDPTALSGLKRLLVGGEALSVSHIRNAKKELSGTKLINGYGPTEATTFSCTFEIGNVLEGACSIPIGSPISNSTVFVLDDSFQSVPIGVHGELYIGGDGLASGYLGRPEQTAERFIPDSLSGAEGGRLYRTGDLVRFLAEGNIDFLGRTDKQVKIRGYRIELGEIEAVLQSHPAVKQIAVVVNRGALDKKIVCCVVPQDPNEFNSSLLRSYLTHRLPHYMIPSQWVVLDHMPLTPGGKIDRVSLERVELLSGEHSEPKQRQKSPTQEVVSAIWCELLGVEQVGVGDNFFDLGGHSLLAMRVVSRLQKLLNVQLTVRAFFENPTIEHLSMLVDKAVSEGNYALARPIRPVDRMQKIPLSFAQQRLWFLDQLDPGNPSYNIPVALKLTGTLNVDALERSLNYLVRRQLSLRTSFVSQDGVPFQTIGDNVEYRLEVEDLRANADANLVASAKALQLARSPFDLSKGPLFRTRLFRTGHTEWLFVIVLHHIIGDGWSLEVLMRDLSQLYQRFAENSPGELPDLKLQYLDYAVWEREYLSAEAIEPSLKFWKEQLVGIPPVLELPQDKPRPSVQSYKGATVHLDFSPVLSNKLKLIARSRQSTLFMTLLTLFEVLLFRYCRQPLFSIGTPVANRSNPDVENIIGFFVNTLVIRAGLSTQVSFLDQLSLVRDTCLSAYAHQQLPFERLVEELHPDRNLSNTPLFQVMFSVRNTARLPDKLGTLDISQFNLDIQSAKFDLSLSIHDGADGLSLSLSYNTDVFDQVSIVRMLNHYQTLSESAVFDPSQLVAQLQLLSPAETHQLTSEWNDTETQQDLGTTIVALFEQQSEKTPEAIALRYKEDHLSYRALNGRANQLGRHLRRTWATPGQKIAISLTKSVEMIVAVLGVLKAGAAYVPLDPAYPRQRVEWLIADAEASVVLGNGAPGGELGSAKQVILNEEWSQIGAESSENLGLEIAAESPAYVIYTSGSSGKPKGVVVPHSAISNHLLWRNSAYPLSQQDAFLFNASFSFDISVWQMFGTLICGAKLVIPESGWEADTTYLIRLIQDCEVTAAHFGPAMLVQMLSDIEIRSCRTLRQVFCGGEQLSVDLKDAFLTKLNARLDNQYGPTEACVDVTIGKCGQRRDKNVVSIGRPIANTRIHLIDEDMQLMPIGAKGELCVAGPGLATGYMNGPDLTAESFVPDPFASEAGERMYRTGDVARFAASGEIEFCGRRDGQLKVRGYRIELGEVEAALNAHACVKQAAAAATEQAGYTRLVAYAVTESGVRPAQLNSFLRDRLPDYMIPAVILTLDEMPLTPNGKIDRRVLSKLAETATIERPHEDAPTTDIEEIIAHIWSEVLSLTEVGRRENFFELGGHSLLATRVVARVNKLLKARVDLRTLFEKPTVEAFSREVVRGMKSREPAAPPIGRTAHGQTVPLSFAQQRHFSLDQGQRTRTIIPNAVRLKGKLNVEALFQAISEITRRHQTLRTSIHVLEGQPVQVVTEDVVSRLHLLDLSGEQLAQELALALTRSDARKGFDLAAAPLLRVRLLKMSQDDLVLLFTMHHIVSDGWSLGIIISELSALYEAYTQGRESPLNDLEVQYADYALWEREYLQGETLHAALGYWTRQLEGATTPLNLPADRSYDLPRNGLAARHNFAFGDDLSGDVRTLSRREGASVYMVLLAVYQMVLYEWTKQPRFIIGTSLANRIQPETENLIGVFVNRLPLRCDLSGDPSFRELLARTREMALGVYCHQEIPIELVGLPKSESSSSIESSYRAYFNMFDFGYSLPELPGVESTFFNVDIEGTTTVPINLVMYGGSSGLGAFFGYDASLFYAESIAQLANRFLRFTEKVVATPGEAVSSLLELG